MSITTSEQLAEIIRQARRRQQAVLPLIIAATKRCGGIPGEMTLRRIRAGLVAVDEMPCPFTDAEIQAAIESQPCEN